MDWIKSLAGSLIYNKQNVESEGSDSRHSPGVSLLNSLENSAPLSATKQARKNAENKERTN